MKSWDRITYGGYLIGTVSRKVDGFITFSTSISPIYEVLAHFAHVSYTAGIRKKRNNESIGSCFGEEIHCG